MAYQQNGQIDSDVLNNGAAGVEPNANAAQPEPQPTKTIEKRRLADLSPHPKQAGLFEELPEEQIKALAENIKANGLHHEIEILPDGTIVCGHQRARALKLLGWEEVNCWVRYDLDDLAVEARLIDDNLQRRQLSPLEAARCYKRLKEMGWNRWTDEVKKREDLRDVIGRRLGLSGRKLDRLIRILDAPVEVQRAYETGVLTQADAEWVGQSSKEVQEKIAREIDSGVSSREAVKAAKKQERIHDYERYKMFRRLADTTERLAELVAKDGLTAHEEGLFERVLEAIERIAKQPRATERPR